MKLRFIRDRGQLFLDFQSTAHQSEKDWYSIDVVRRLITGDRFDSAELDEGYAAFLEERIDEIESLFSESRLSETVDALRRLERVRAKELFD